METAEREPVEIDRTTPQYREGKLAFMEHGASEDDNPYPKGHNSRVGWFTGFYDARTNHRLGHIFRRYGVTYP